MTIKEEIDSKRFLSLVKTYEPEINTIEITVTEAVLGEEMNVAVNKKVMTTGNILERKKENPIYKLIFKDYIAYSIIEETSAVVDDYEVYTGNLIRFYSKSHFIDYIAKVTSVNYFNNELFFHFQIACIDHVIDIASKVQPIITK